MKWETRTICTYVAATVPVEKAGDVNELLAQAQKVGLEDVVDADENGEPKPIDQPVNEPKIGSYEAFMSSFGSPRKWAGR